VLPDAVNAERKDEREMIQIRIRERCEERGISNPYQLQVAADLYPSMASRLFNHDFKQISMETLDKLCEALDCETSDLLVRVPEKRSKGAKKKGVKG